MDFTPQNKTYYKRTLEEVFLSFYSAAVLNEIYVEWIEPLVPPAQRPQKSTKTVLCPIFLDVFKSSVRMKQAIDAMPPLLHKAVSILLWHKVMKLTELHERLGEPVAFPKEETKAYYFDTIPMVCRGAQQLLVISRNRNAHFYGGSHTQPEELCMVSLPPAVRKALLPWFPKPRYWNLEPLEQAPKKGVSFDASAHIAADLSVLADYLQRGSIRRNQQGKFPKPVIRAMAALTAGGDFDTALQGCKALELARHGILASLLGDMPQSFLETMRKHPFPMADVLPQLIAQLSNQPATLLSCINPHLKLRSSFCDNRFFPRQLKQLFDLFADMPTGKWITSVNLVTHAWLQEKDYLFFEWPYYRFKPAPDSPGRNRFMSSAEDLDDDNLFDLASVPTLLGCAFVLAAFGVLEIRYTTPPQHHAWYSGKDKFLTQWDGLLAVRLTDVGAYCFGKTTSLELTLPQQRDSAIRFNGPRLLAFSKTDDPVTRQALEEFLDRAGPGVYRFSAAKLFKGCFEKKQLAERIADFRSRIDVALPEEWEAVLKGLLDAPQPLQRAAGFTVYQIDDQPQLRQRFASDPLLRENCLRVEGWRVAIHADNIKRVREHLRSLGYFLEGNVGSATPAKKALKKPRRRRYF
jgi:hypothetical protein